VEVITDGWAWLTTSAHWEGPGGIPTRLVEHLQYSALALLVAVALALPLGLLLGHTGRASIISLSISGAARAVPTLGLLVLLNRLDPVATWPAIVVLAVLAVPPILANAYTGVDGVDPAVRDAARGQGMTGRQVLFGIEVPLALPIVLAGLRSATSQVIATATVAAYLGIGGLGRYIIDGVAVRDYGRVFGGAVVVAALALASELAYSLVQRAVGPGRRIPVRAVNGATGTAPAPATADTDGPVGDAVAGTQTRDSPEHATTGGSA
jgi:osmoprotectant transport system permease protein